MGLPVLAGLPVHYSTGKNVQILPVSNNNTFIVVPGDLTGMPVCRFFPPAPANGNDFAGFCRCRYSFAGGFLPVPVDFCRCERIFFFRCEMIFAGVERFFTGVERFFTGFKFRFLMEVLYL